MRILFKDLDAGPVYQESIVEDEKVVIKNAKRVTLFASDKYQYITVIKYVKLSKERKFYLILYVRYIYLILYF